MLDEIKLKSEDVNVSEMVDEWVEDSGVISDLGFPYPLRIRVYAVQGKMYLDEILDAPWQVGGNSGHVRELLPLSEEEYKLLRER